MRKLKSPVLPVFLVLMLLALSLRFVWFSIYLSSKKAEFREQVLCQTQEGLIRLKIPLQHLHRDSPGFVWKESGRELVIGEVYHEVIAVKTGKTAAELFLIADKAENRLFSNYFRLRENEGNLSDPGLLLLGMTYLSAKTLVQVPIAAMRFVFKSVSGVMSPGFLSTCHPPPRSAKNQHNQAG